MRKMCAVEFIYYLNSSKVVCFMDESPWNESIHTNKSWADIRTPNTFPKSGDEKTCQILMTISSKCMLPFMIMDGTNNTYSTIT